MPTNAQFVPQSRLRKASVIVLSAAGLMAGGLATAAPAAATAETCIAAARGVVCTKVWGSGTYVESVRNSLSTWRSVGDWPCNYASWFYYVPPKGGAIGLGYQKRAGCNPAAAWLKITLNRSFPKNTLVCGKFYVNYDSLVAEKCVGVS